MSRWLEIVLEWYGFGLAVQVSWYRTNQCPAFINSQSWNPIAGLMDWGIDINKFDVSTHAKESDEVFIIAYPHFNVNGTFKAWTEGNF